MAKHHDHHTCECAHERLKFCKPCNATYCLDCREEWRAPCTLNHNWWGISYTPTYPTWTSAGYGAGDATFTMPARGDEPVDFTPTITCAGHN